MKLTKSIIPATRIYLQSVLFLSWCIDKLTTKVGGFQMIHLSLLYLRSFFILMLNQFLFRQSISLINRYLFGDNLATVDKQGAEVSIEGGRHRLLGALPGFNQNNLGGAIIPYLSRLNIFSPTTLPYATYCTPSTSSQQYCHCLGPFLVESRSSYSVLFKILSGVLPFYF